MRKHIDYRIALAASIGLYILLLFGARYLDQHWHPQGVSRVALNLSPMIGAAVIAWSVMKALWQMDELQRRIQFDFDMIPNRWEQSLSPGNEQAFYWGSAAADTPGSRNYMGARSPAVDAMIAALLAATSRGALVAAVRALDRVLVSGHYVVPLHHLPAQWVARWTTVAHPAATSLYGWLPETWWRAPGR